MGLGKKTINLVKKVLNNKNKRSLYTREEIVYMEAQLERLIENRKRRKADKRKGFNPVTSNGNSENFDD